MTVPDDAAGPLAEAAKELIPKVYEDGIQQSIKEIGHTLHGVVRTALRPVNALVWTVDQASEWLESRVTHLLAQRGVSTDRVLSPSPQILYGVIRGVQATGPEADHNLREMYVNLLATAMDTTTARMVHPAFAEILHQMLPDEARIIQVLGHHRGQAVVEVSARGAKTHHGSDPFETGIHSLRGEAKCLENELIPSYIDNLKRLGIVTEHDEILRELPQKLARAEQPPEFTEFAKWLVAYDYPALVEWIDHLPGGTSSSAVLLFIEMKIHLIKLTSFGKQFVNVCVGD